MIIGKIIDLTPSSSYVTVKDEHKQDYSVHISEVPADLEVGDDYSYHVDLWDMESGRVTTLRYEREGF